MPQGDNAPVPDQDQTIRLLHLLEQGVEGVILKDPGSDMARNMATIAGRLLRRALVDRSALPQLRTAAIEQYRAMLPELRGLLAAPLHARLAAGLDGEVDWASLDEVLNDVVPALLVHGGASAQHLASRLLATDAGVRNGKEQAWLDRSRPVADAAPAAQATGLSDEQRSRLLTFLKQEFAEETALRIVDVRQVPGGYSKFTLFIDLAGNVALPATLVVRWDGTHYTSGTSVTMEFPVIQKMYAAGVAVPKPFAAEISGAVLDRPFVVLGLAEGGTIGDFVVVSQPNRAAALDLARQLALVHSVSPEGLEDILPGANQSPRERLLVQLDKHEATWKRLKHHKAFAITSAIEWLRGNAHLADGPRSIVHCDMGPHNYLVHEDRVSAILDWEVCAIGTAAEDIGGLFYTVTQSIEWPDFVAEYEKAADIAFDVERVNFYILWAAFRLGVMVNAIAEPAFAGERDSLSEYYLGEYIGQILIERVATKLADILDPVTPRQPGGQVNC